MSATGTPETKLTSDDGALDGRRMKVAIVAASWHQQVMDGLIDGALRACTDAEVQTEMVRVPGSFELPLAASVACRNHDAVVALGVVVRGGTPHFDYVCQAATDGLTRVALDRATPVGFGVLTCDTDAQALDRAGLPGSREDKGYEAASAAIRMVAALAPLGGI